MIRAGAHEGGEQGRQTRMASNVDIYKSQDRPPPGVKRSSTAKTGSQLWEPPTPRIRRHHGEPTPLLWTIRTVVGVSSGAPPTIRESATTRTYPRVAGGTPPLRDTPRLAA